MRGSAKGLALSRTASDTLTVTGCAPATPCNSQMGGNVYAVTSAPTIGNSYQTGQWTASVADTWEATGTDLRSAVAERLFARDTGISATETSSQRTVAAHATAIPQKFFGTAAPASVAGTLPGDLSVETTNHLEYLCDAPSGTAAPARTSVTLGGRPPVTRASNSRVELEVLPGYISSH